VTDSLTHEQMVAVDDLIENLFPNIDEDTLIEARIPFLDAIDTAALIVMVRAATDGS
jgi:hypothetical protein